jgi:hypothetical protein
MRVLVGAALMKERKVELEFFRDSRYEISGRVLEKINDGGTEFRCSENGGTWLRRLRKGFI